MPLPNNHLPSWPAGLPTWLADFHGSAASAMPLSYNHHGQPPVVLPTWPAGLLTWPADYRGSAASRTLLSGK